MAGFTHKTLRIPMGLLTHSKIPLPFRLMLYFSQGPEVNFVSARKLACIMGMDVSTPERAEKAATIVRVTRGRMVTDGLLVRVEEAGVGRNDGFRVIVPDAPQTALDMLGSLDCNVYMNASAEEKASGQAPSVKLPKTAVAGWDCIPWYGGEEHFAKLMPFAFTTDRKQLNYFWNGFCARVTSIMKRSKTAVPVAVVSMMVLMWTANQLRTNGYPPSIKNQGGYVLKVMIGRDFPIASLKDKRFVQEALKVLRSAEGTLALRAYLRESETTKVAQFTLSDQAPEEGTNPIPPHGNPTEGDYDTPVGEPAADGSGDRAERLVECGDGGTSGSTDEVLPAATESNAEERRKAVARVREGMLQGLSPDAAETMRQRWERDDLHATTIREVRAAGKPAPVLTPDQKRALQLKQEEERWRAFRDKERKARAEYNKILVAGDKPPAPELTDEELRVWYREEFPGSLVTE